MKNNTTIEVKRNVIKNNMVERYNDLQNHKKVIDKELKDLEKNITNELNNNGILGKTSKFNVYLKTTSKKTFPYKDILKNHLLEKFESTINKFAKYSISKKLIVELK